MAVLNFIKSLFLPKHMAKYRFMTVLIAICLFVVSTYILILPARYYYQHNTTKLVDNNNLYYLQSVRDIDRFAPTNESITSFEEEIVTKGIYGESGNVKASHLGLYSLEVSGDVLGYVEKKDGHYFYNSIDTNIIINDTTKDYPTITALDGSFMIDGVNDKTINSPTLTNGEEVDVIKISLVSSNSHLEIDGVDSGTILTSEKAVVSISGGKLVVNGVETSKTVTNKAIIYFIPRTTTYYERDFSYVSDKGVTQNFKFVIDLTKTYVATSPYTIDSYECDYLNQDYYFILIYNEAVYYQAHLAGINDKNVTRDDKALTCQAYNVAVSKTPFDLTNMVPSDFGNYLYTTLINGYNILAISNFSIISLIYCVLYPLVVSLLFSLLFRKTGRMKKFKEYYNIASITNIVPMLITFVVMWFNPSLFGTVYLIAFALYYIFVLYKINNSSETI